MWRILTQSGSHFSRRRVALAPLAAALLGTCALPAHAASHTISAGVVVYDAATFGSDDILVDGATAVLQIGAVGVPLANAISLDNGGTLDNSGSIVRSGPGMSGKTGTVLNSGSIESTGDDGVYFELGGTVTNQAGASITGTTGILNDWPAGSGPGHVTNSGTITGTSGPGVDMENGGTVLNRGGGKVTGTDYGVFAWEGVDVTNTGAGSLINGGTQAISLNDGGSLTNSDRAAVSSDQVGVGVFEGGTIDNSGGATITGDANDGVYFAQGGTLTNSGAGSVIRGGWNGIRLEGGGSIANTGGAEIIGGHGTSAAAIYLADGGTVTNGAGSRIVGDSTAGTYGIYASQSATISNAGTIVGDVRLADQRENHVTLFTGSRIEGDLYVSVLDGDSTFTLDGEGTQLLSGAVSGLTTFVQGGTLIKTGSGTWIIDTNSSGGFAPQAISIAGGTLEARNNTALTGGTVTVEYGGRIGGNGRVGKLVVQSGGTVAPGNSTGTLTVSGAYQPGAGSIYEAEVSGDSTSDLVKASGAATIAAGALLKPVKYDATPLTVGTTYTVVNSTGTRTGTFTLVDGGALTAFLAAADSYDTHHVYLTINQNRALTDAALTRNQLATAGALQSAPVASTPVLAVLNAPDDAAARAAFDQLSGELHASVRMALLDEARAPREAALERLRQTLSHGAAIWGRSYGTIGHTEGDGNAAALDTAAAGFLAGADVPLGDAGRLGVFGGIGEDAVSGRGSAASSDFTLAGYGGTRLGPIALRFGGTATVHAISTRRPVTLPGYAVPLTADYGGTSVQLFGEAGYGLVAGVLTIEPYAGLSYAALHTAGFDEGTNGVAGTAADVSLTTTTLGLRASAELGAVSLAADLGWEHIPGAGGTTAEMRFAGSPAFTIAGTPLPRDRVVAGLDLGLALSSAADLSLSYNGNFAPGAGSHAVTGQLRIRF